MSVESLELPDSDACLPGGESCQRPGRVTLPFDLRCSGQIDIENDRAAIELLELSIDESHSIELAPRDDTHGRLLERGGKLNFEVDLLALVEDPCRNRAIKHGRVDFAFISGGTAGVGIGPDIDRLLHCLESLVITP